MNEGRLTPDGKWEAATAAALTQSRPPRARWYQNRWLQMSAVGVVLLLIGIGIGSAGGSSSSKSTAATPVAPATVTSVAAGETATVNVTTTQTATATVTTTYTPVPQTAFAGDGTFLVGKEVTPGTYESDGPSTSDGIGECSYSVNSQGSGIDAIITNGNSAGQTIIQVPANAYTVTTQGCDPFHRV